MYIMKYKFCITVCLPSLMYFNLLMSQSTPSLSQTGVLEGQNAKLKGQLVSLSEQQLVACDSTNFGCNGG